MSTVLEVDQSAGDLTLHTGRAGLGSKVGHDLTLRVGQWSGVAELADDGTVSALQLTAALRSLEVLRGDGGLKPLSDKDKGTILSNAMDTLKAKAYPDLVFEASGLTLAEGQSRVTGTVALAGATGAQDLELTVAREGNVVRVQAHGELVQSAFGIKPYSGMLGALKVQDTVEVRADLSVSLR